jgi:hypothetical protein
VELADGGPEEEARSECCDPGSRNEKKLWDIECLWWWPRREGREPDEDEGVRELSGVDGDPPPNLNPSRRPSLLGRSRSVVTGAGTSTLSSSIVGSGIVPGRGKNTERLREWIRLWRLLVVGCPEDMDLCCISGADTDCGNAKDLNDGESGGGGNKDGLGGENELDKGDRSGGENSLGFLVDSDFVLEWDGWLRGVLPLPLRVGFALFPKVMLYGPAEVGWYCVGGKDCEVGMPMVNGLVPTPGVEWTRVLGELIWLSMASRPGVAGISFMTTVGPFAIFSPFILVSLCVTWAVQMTPGGWAGLKR